MLRTGRRGLQMVLRLLAHNAEHWLSDQLNAYLRDHDEYRAITRETIIRGTAGIIAFTPGTITVTLRSARRTAHRPRPGPAHRPDQHHPARDARRHQAHHLPAHREPGDLTPGLPHLPEIWDYGVIRKSLKSPGRKENPANWNPIPDFTYRPAHKPPPEL